jgi:hypothetical protein
MTMIMTWALSLIPIMAMTYVTVTLRVRSDALTSILFTRAPRSCAQSLPHCWSRAMPVGLFHESMVHAPRVCQCHPATCALCASASIMGSLASLSSSDHSWWNPTAHPLKSSGLVAFVNLNPRSIAPLRAVQGPGGLPCRQVCGEDPYLSSGAGSNIPDTIAVHACSHWHVLLASALLKSR